jgi:hypothetical protein
MTPELAKLIQEVLLEALKLLGPATVAAYFTYRATSAQWETKLKELDLTNEFNARDRIYAHLKERLSHIDVEIAKLHEGVGQMLGMASGADSQPSESDRKMLNVMASLVRSTAKAVPLEVNATLNDMTSMGLSSTEEAKALEPYRSFSLHLEPQPAYSDLKAALFELLDVHNILGSCTRLLLQTQMEKVFERYTR